MLNLKKSLITGLFATGVALTSMSSFAQMPPPGPGPGPDAHHAPTPEQIAKMEQWRAKREAKLHDKLKITAAQEDAWKTFITKTTPQRPPEPPKHLSKDEWSKLTAPELLDRQQEHMKHWQEAHAQRITATKEFYAVLTADQQKVFDEEFRKMEQRRMHQHRPGPWHDQGKDDAAGK
ncbi:Spy/CpxP family protein refolding chaperone [Herbaspirillum sp. Sphag1AN]|uniref:Spy/CpxP family protein refolding chaperone n=1 Tax=unclassified Herbaspirillum TaxID=2624150 RepID=UPI0016171FE5|nr:MULTISPECIES: Spy/CpxP family protein refolding chaperone [unclassified Herbaspirillum]MBB3210823.1 Spy/CpxP family protein refolding chaperone [Herbaspirillum sp. Sphag1AN]MBB3244453.1 Spy/CpxP family protein refolding chaperone [Herbaspirillum sp. Sphag64]